MRQDGGYAIGDKVPMGKAIVYSLQHLMAFVGGGAIVPAMIMGLNPALAVFCTGLGTIIYLFARATRCRATSACRSASSRPWPW